MHATDEPFDEAAAGRGLVHVALRSVTTEARVLANRYLVGTLLATTGAAGVLMHRLLPERHRLLPDHDTMWTLASLEAWALVSICGVTVTVEGLGRLERGGPFIIVANHQSDFDVACLLGFLPGTNRFVATQAYVVDGLFGPVLRASGLIAAAEGSADRTLKKLEEFTKSNVSAIMFPEGRRGPGPRLLPFADLPFRAAIEFGIPIVPVAIRGTRRIMPAGALFGVRPGRVEMIVEEPIPTTDLICEDVSPLREDVRSVIARYVEEVDAVADEDAGDDDEDRDQEALAGSRNGTVAW